MKDMDPRDEALIKANARIMELEALLRRIDAVTLWETHPLGRSFQEEVEAALGIGSPKSPVNG